MIISVIIPVYNAGENLRVLIDKIEQNLINLEFQSEIIIIDSQSTDGSTDFITIEKPEINLINIKNDDFNHGGTRNLGADIAEGNILVYITQDALPYDDSSIKNLIEPIIVDERIAMSYGRQLPHKNADYFGGLAREINYPAKSLIKSKKQAKELGIKTVFVSNSFAAYNKDLLNLVGGFPSNTILSEDTFVAAKFVLNNYKIAYTAEAKVYHSHNYSISQEFKRNFDIGTFYGREKWILQEFSSAEKEGIVFVWNQLKNLLSSRKINLIPNLLIRNFVKFVGYRLGINEKLIPLSVKKRISMHKKYWIH